MKSSEFIEQFYNTGLLPQYDRHELLFCVAALDPKSAELVIRTLQACGFNNVSAHWSDDSFVFITKHICPQVQHVTPK